jgi:hypothetical protein
MRKTGPLQQWWTRWRWRLIVAIAVFAFGLALFNWSKDSREDTPPYLPAPSVQRPIAEESRADSDALDQRASSATIAEDAPPLSLDEEDCLISSILQTPIGQLTAEESLLLIREFLDMEGARVAIGDLLSSPIETERVLGVYLKLALDGYSNETLSYAVGEDSPYVRAEIAEWLYRQGEFDQLQEYLSAISLRATDADLARLLESAQKNPTYLDVTPVMSRLGLGEGIDRYFQELLQHNQALRALSLAATLNPANDAQQRMALLGALRFGRGEDWEEVLLALLDEDNAPFLIQNFAVRELSASLPADDHRIERARAAFLASLPDWFTPEPISTQEDLRAARKAFEAVIDGSIIANQAIDASLWQTAVQYANILRGMPDEDFQSQEIAERLGHVLTRRVPLPHEESARRDIAHLLWKISKRGY